MLIHDGKIIAENLTMLGMPCIFCNYKLSPQKVYYNFTVQNINSISKQKQVINKLSFAMGEKITVLDGGAMQLRLSFNAPERQYPKWSCVPKSTNAEPTALVGIDENGKPVYLKLSDMVSSLCVGTSGSGKSTFLDSFIMSLACGYGGKKVSFVMIDTKEVELTKFKKLPHLICDVVTDTTTALARLEQVIDLMNQRYSEMRLNGIRKMTDEYSHIVIVVDELADLIMSSDKTTSAEIQKALEMLCQKGRACGIHCLLCTQSPYVKVITGLIQTNTPTKFALKTANTRQSVMAIGHKGCESLLGCGDMWFKPANSSEEIRIQVPYISTAEIDKLLEPLPVRQWNSNTVSKKPKNAILRFWEKISNKKENEKMSNGGWWCNSCQTYVGEQTCPYCGDNLDFFKPFTGNYMVDELNELDNILED